MDADRPMKTMLSSALLEKVEREGGTEAANSAVVSVALPFKPIYDAKKIDRVRAFAILMDIRTMLEDRLPEN